MMDLKNKVDLEFFLRAFYSKMIKDQILSPFFVTLNFKEHLPQIVHFWDFVLFGASGYTTNVVQKHHHMALTKDAFEKWLFLFNTTLDEMFQGEKASEAKQRAWLIGETMKSKLLA